MSKHNESHPEVTLFGKDDTLVTNDIEQGALGNNYFLTMAAAVAEHNPELIRNIFN